MAKRGKNSGIAVAFIIMLFAAPFAAIQYKIPTILPQLVSDSLATCATAPWLITMFTISGAVMTLVAGPVADRVGVKKAMVVAALFTLAGSALAACIQQPFPLVIARAVEGIGFGLICVCGPVVIERCVAQEKQGFTNGVWGVWIPFGAFCGEILSPVIYGSPLGFAGVCLLLAVPIAIVGLVMLRFVGDVDDASASEKAEQAGSQTGSVLKALNKNLLFLLIGWLSFNLLNFAVMSYAPSYLQGTGMDPALSGFVTTIPMVLSLATCPIGGMIIDRFKCAKQVLIVALAANLVTVVMLFTQQGILVWVAVIAMGLLATMTFVATLSALPRTLSDPSWYPTAVSLYMFVQVGGELLAGLLVPVVLGSSLDNWTALVAACAITGAVGLLCGILVSLRNNQS